MVRMRTLALWSLLGFGSHAQATILCSYAAYTPESVHYFLTGGLMDRGFSVAPAVLLAPAEAEANKALVVHDSGLYGSLLTSFDRAAGVSTLNILNSDGKEIGSASETVTACDGGICRHATIQASVGGTFSKLEIWNSPRTGISYYAGNVRVGVTEWRSQLEEHFAFIFAQLTDSHQRLSMIAPTAVQTLNLRFFSDPLIFPYMDRLTLFEEADGHMVLAGTTNYETYNRIIDQAIAAGFYTIEPRVTIDSGIQYFGPELPADLRRCR